MSTYNIFSVHLITQFTSVGLCYKLYTTDMITFYISMQNSVAISTTQPKLMHYQQLQKVI